MCWVLQRSRLLLPFERFLRGEHNKPLPVPYTKPVHKQLISNIAANKPKNAPAHAAKSHDRLDSGSRESIDSKTAPKLEDKGVKVRTFAILFMMLTLRWCTLNYKQKDITLHSAVTLVLLCYLIGQESEKHCAGDFKLTKRLCAC